MPDVRKTLTRRNLLLAASSVAAMALLAACGDEDSSPERSDAPESSEVPESSATPETATETEVESTVQPTPTAELGPSGHFDAVQVHENGTRHLIPLDKIQSGGPPKDGIPSIDEPQFVGRDAWADQDLEPDRFVLGIEVNGQRRAYPFQILVWHELVNDVIDGLPILASNCPLCGSAIAFVREIEVDGQIAPVEFGVSGKLYNSDLLMYDRETDSLWSQLTGTAVVGDLAGQRLQIYPSELMTWENWVETYPDSQVLTRDTGYDRNYDARPYEGYEENAQIWFSVPARDDRLFEKTRVTGIELGPATFAAYPDGMVAEHGPVNHEIAGTPLLIVADVDAGGNVRVFRRDLDDRELTFVARDGMLMDKQTDSLWTFNGVGVDGEFAGSQLEAVNTIKGFWFAWFAFHPQTELWLPEEGSG